MNDQTILVVDDTPHLLKLSKEIFEIGGFQVLTANDGDEALTILAEKKVDLVFTDILMPNTDGYILCYTIRNSEVLKDMPVIIYSATYTSSSDEEMAIEIGADRFIRKPAAMDELISAAKYLLSNNIKSRHKIPARPKSLEASKLYNEGLVNKLERRNLDLEEARTKMQQINERFEFVSKATSDAIWDWDILSDTTYWNHGLKSIFGYEDQVTANSIAWRKDKIHPQDYDRTSREIELAFTSQGQSWISNYRYKGSDGNYRQVYDRAHIIYNDGRAVRMIGAMQDVTENKKLEALLSNVNRLARIGAWEWDLINQTHYWSDMTYELHEVQRNYEPSKEKAIQFYKAGENRDRIIQRTSECIEKGIPWDEEFQITTALGNEKWIRVIGEAEFSNGKCIKLYGSFQDIDARKKAELASIDSLKEKNTILESIGDGFFAVDKNMIVTYWNNQAEKMIGKTKQEMIGQNLWQVFKYDEDSASYKNYKKAIETNQAVMFETYSEILAKWFEVSVYPLENGLSVYVKDISDRKLVEADLDLKEEAKRKELEKLVEERTHDLYEALRKEKDLVDIKNKFVSIASHEFRTPLSTISLAAESVRTYFKKLKPEEIQKKLLKIEDQAAHMTHLLEDILTIGKSEAGKIKVKMISLDLEEFIKSLIEEVKGTTKEKRKIKLQFSSSRTLINADDKLLRNIINNLLTNAIKFSDSKSTITITVSDAAGVIGMEVSDEGIGIPGDELKTIFESFQRGSNVSNIQGTGLGLSILKKAVELMNGTVEVKSTLGKGSVFKVQIPAE